jgi:16S rRNA (cytidine1402-2'-O)-methyltransferase
VLNPKPVNLTPGLYLVATPIGAARDITLRALDVLTSADVLVAEDTRTLRKLMEIHGVPLRDRQILSYHDHNGAQMRPRLLALLEQGKSLAYASEAGTPMVADPGFDLARAARDAGLPVHAAPGPSAVIMALTVGGMPTDRFFFAGFLPNVSGQRKTALRRYADIPGTLVFYESPNRIAAMLRDSAEILGPDRRAAICRELTKKFEEVISGTLTELAEICTERKLKGECVVLIDRVSSVKIQESDVETLLQEVLVDLSLRDAVDLVTARTGLPRRQVYQVAIKMEQGE